MLQFDTPRSKIFPYLFSFLYGHKAGELGDNGVHLTQIYYPGLQSFLGHLYQKEEEILFISSYQPGQNIGLGIGLAL